MNARSRSLRPFSTRHAALVAAAVFSATPAFANTWAYTGPDGGNWNVSTSWTMTGNSTHIVPVNGDDATLGGCLTVQNVTLNMSYTGAGLNSLTLDSPGHASITLTQSTNVNMIATNEYIGTTVSANTYTQSAGNNTVSGNVILGFSNGGYGTYNLSGTAILTAGSEYVGYNGTGGGIFTQSGGTNNVAILTVNQTSTNVTSTYNFSAGTINIAGPGGIIVANSGVGSFSQTGGNVVMANANSGILLGDTAGALGTYTISNGNITGVGALVIGVAGSGSFIQNGGTITTGCSGNYGGNLYVGDSGAGCYSLSSSSSTATLNTTNATIGLAAVGNMTQGGGTFNGNTITVGSNAASSGSSFTISGGIVNSAQIQVGLGTTASFTQSGGNVNLTAVGNDSLSVGTNAAGNGTYSLSGISATLTALNEYVGDSGNGKFLHSNGNNSVSNALYIGYAAGSNGNYSQTGGNLTITAGILYDGYQGTGNMGLSAGNMTTNQLVLAYSPSSSSNYSLSGTGNLTVTSFEVVGGGGQAFFTQSFGTHTVDGDVQIGQNSTGNGTITVGSGTFHVLGNIGDGQAGTGNLAIIGGNTNIDISLYIGSGTGSTGKLFISNGNLTVNNTIYLGNQGTGTFTQIGGNVTTPVLDIGASQNIPAATGSYTQSSGTLTVTSNAYLGLYSVSSYNLSGGILNAPNTPPFNNFFISSFGTFNQSGGTVNGYVFNGGNFNFSGGVFNGTLENGATGTANFTSFVYFGQGLLNHGTMNINGGQVGTNTGIAFSNDGTINISNAGQIYALGPVVNTGTINIAGTLGGTSTFVNNNAIIQGNGPLTINYLANAFTNNGSISLASGRVLNLYGGITNQGTILLNSATVTQGGTIINNAGGTIEGPGLFLANIANNGGTILPGNGTLNFQNAWNNGGFVNLTSITSAITGAAITNFSTIQGLGSISAPINNQGTIEALGGTLNLSSVLTTTAASTLAVSTDNKLLLTAGLASNTGLITLTGGTFDNGGHTLLNNGTISGYGTFRTGGLTNAGNITFSGSNGSTTTVTGDVTNNAGKTLNIKLFATIFSGNLTNNGTVKTTSTTFTVAGTFTNNGNYTSDPSINIFQSNLTSNGNISGGTGDTFNMSGGTFTNNGNFTGLGTLVSSDNTNNSGNFYQSGPQTWSGSPTFTNTGNATFASNSGSATSAPLTLINNAGTTTFASSQNINSITVNAGNLSLTAGATKTNSLTLAGSSNNWTGLVDLTTAKLIVEDTTNHAATLATIKNQAGFARTNGGTAGVTSSTLPSGKTIVISDNAIAGLTTFGGQSVDAGSIIETTAFLGDYNLDGVVDLKDLQDIANHWQQSVSDWSQGDVDGNGKIDLIDLQAIANHWQAGVGSGSGSGESLSLVGSLGGSGSTVPEPSTLLLFAAAPLLLRRRK